MAAPSASVLVGYLHMTPTQLSGKDQNHKGTVQQVRGVDTHLGQPGQEGGKAL